MFFHRRPEGQRATRPRRSLSETIKLTLSFLSSKSSPPPDPYGMPPSPRRIEDIGRPKQLRHRVRQHPDSNSDLHFIHRLPVEILALIFLAGSEDDIFFPVTISHVSRAWRQIALRTPTLWRRISLSPKERMWKERIRRARACSLDIQLLPIKTRSRGEPKHADLDPYSIQWHMHIVLPYINRWRSLEIVFPEFVPYLWKAALSRCCSRSGAQAPLIEDLKLLHRANEDPEAFTLFSGSAPRLRKATLNGIRLNWLPSLFAGLTYLDYTHHGFTAGHQAVHDVVDMLKVSSQLVDLRITFPRKPVVCLPCRQDAVCTQVCLPRLQTLQLRVEGKDIPFELARIATLLITPSLRSLRLIDQGRSYNSFASLKQFFYIYALPPSLNTVRIEHGWYDPRMVTPIAQSHSKVRQIIIKRSHQPEQVINLKPLSRTRKVSHNGKPVPATSSTNADWTSKGSHFGIQRLDVQYF
ncbi:hypothetical protein D9611_008705 [Ephemerocybe angulata]|uniref:F-box domain-containing protein n=1 Tax=Ephemerocybe angulata TaxID=980116 RepID=A0A8H5FJC9_9AGAR|nr:hypothetical protein D9611_008705 [Tulosesus angulatus]